MKSTLDRRRLCWMWVIIFWSRFSILESPWPQMMTWYPLICLTVPTDSTLIRSADSIADVYFGWKLLVTHKCCSDISVKAKAFHNHKSLTNNFVSAAPLSPVWAVRCDVVTSPPRSPPSDVTLSHSAQIKSLPISKLVPLVFAVCCLQAQFVFSEGDGTWPILTDCRQFVREYNKGLLRLLWFVGSRQEVSGDIRSGWCE